MTHSVILSWGRRTQYSPAACFLVLLLLSGGSAHAQLQNTGVVLGTVTDSTGGVIPAAKVALTSTEQGTVAIKTSNSAGQYLFPSVAIGTYTLTVSAPGFATTVVDKVIVDADKNVQVDAKLTLSNVETTVTVNASANTVNTQSATIGVLIDNNLVQNLPIDGNNVVSLAALLPGVSTVSAPTTFTSDTAGPSYNVSGARNTQNLFLLDGSLWNNLYNNSGLNFPPPSALQEVSVLLNNFKAQYGRNVGSVFNAITKSGSNQFHGVLYEYLENTALNAQDYFLKRPSRLIQNQYGATLGGPIMRDKLFFFASYEGLRIAQTASNNVTTGGFTPADRGLDANGNPTPCSSTGYFAGTGNCINLSDLAGPTYRNADGSPELYLHNPLASPNQSTPAVVISSFNAAYVQAGHTLAAGQNSPCVNLLQSAQTQAGAAITLLNNELPMACVNPVVLSLITTYLPEATPKVINGDYVTVTPTSYPFPQNDQNGLLRFDYVPGHGHTIDVRYYQTSANDISAHNVTSPTNPSVAGYEPDADYGSIHFGDIGDTWVLGPNLLNVLRVAYKRYDYKYSPTDPTTLADFGADFPSYNSVPVLPAFPGLGTASQAVSSTVNEDIEGTDTFTWSKGKHNLQFGVDALRLQYENISESAPSFSFGNYTLSLQGDEILGLPSSENFSNALNRSGIQHDYYFFAQDDWRIMPKLTLNLGLRYELPLRYFQPKNRDTTFIPGYQSVVFPNAVPDLAFVGDPGIRRALIKNEYTDIAPRFGFSYDVFGNGHTAIRGGFGIFYDATNALTIGVGEPFNYAAHYAFPSGGVSQPLLGELPIPPNYNGTNPQFNLPFSIFYPDRNFRGSYSEALNIGFQQSIARNGVLEVNYVLRLGRHQALPLDQNPAIYDCSGTYFQINPSLYCYGASATAASYADRVKYPGFNYGGQGVVDYQSIGTSNYNGLQVLYEQRAAHSLSVTSSFSYAKSMDEFSNGATTSNSVPQINNLSSQYGPSDYDVKYTVGVGWVFAPTTFRGGSRLVRTLLSNWTQSGIYTAQTGEPFSVRLDNDAAYTDEPDQRAQLIPGMVGTLPSNRHRAAKIAEWFNTAAWEIPTAGTFSNQSRNGLRGPAFTLLNLSVGRIFSLPTPHRMQLAFRADAVNALNIPNLATPNSELPSTSGIDYEGQILATAGENTVGSSARRIQLSLKLTY